MAIYISVENKYNSFAYTMRSDGFPVDASSVFNIWYISELGIYIKLVIYIVSNVLEIVETMPMEYGSTRYRIIWYKDDQLFCTICSLIDCFEYNLCVFHRKWLIVVTFWITIKVHGNMLLVSCGIKVHDLKGITKFYKKIHAGLKLELNLYDKYW